MGEDNHQNKVINRRDKSLEWQKRWLTPFLLVLSIIILVALIIFDAIPMWLGILLTIFGVSSLISVIRKNKR